jgi:sulfite reductase (NADPH) flavoprotein alpha-component
VLKNERVTAAEHFQDVRHIELKVADSDMAYQPGDLLGMYPEQDPAVVEALLKHLGLDGDTEVRVELAEPAIGSAPTCVKVGTLST